MADTYFKDIPSIRFEGPESENPLAFRYYDKNRMVLGKRMEDQLRCAACYWQLVRRRPAKSDTEITVNLPALYIF